MFYTIEWLDTKWGLNRIHHTYTTKELLKRNLQELVDMQEDCMILYITDENGRDIYTYGYLQDINNFLT